MKRGSTVRFKPAKPARKAATGRGEQVEQIPGTWYSVETSPTGWWLMPSDPRARAWAADHPGRLVSGLLDAPARLIEPSFHI